MTEFFFQFIDDELAKEHSDNQTVTDLSHDMVMAYGAFKSIDNEVFRSQAIQEMKNLGEMALKTMGDARNLLLSVRPERRVRNGVVDWVME
ncbi:hypothetical protein JMN32_05010 [Fulvivirga sp. 29W222]|uniref:Uncharacterized protein n=1 Tax=Fulvivirga marina TaxID=2494733 RepID=A0A937FWJ8_9BACT|nr:hypothetical protein [Fulvivirga marina]MBL6445656.1 hypothetical protein [Fulvivirga marina]